ncbi:glycoside hydrolase family 2 TIM barrel-domain containing protein [Mycolicibacterium sp. P9-22]|uniref:glycoside hydrolase family 2 TIM barrel-domain containing protein n=1 Tax=Mycolicibacterium sp. P9-22 TaxID=2024613 RepID=UPI0011EC9173|nr:glycoside hydrolase family 2 TIM barrel-domain containing protein [Mycolicibacterium sp. P9-22]KAA0120792.1 glycoside hydrolase family 2 protein [Mycolicibacterium sp. P9-22]
MVRVPFNSNWSYRPKTSIFADVHGQAASGVPVRLPHDAIISLERRADAPSGAAGAFFPGGAFEYLTTLEVPLEWSDKHVALEFEGVYRDAMIYVNGAFVAQRPNGYAAFVVSLDGFLEYGAENTIRVDARTHNDSRWYTGAGLYREVHLWVSERVHICEQGGVRITTPDVDEQRAVVAIATRVRNTGTLTRPATVTTEILDPDGDVVGVESSPITTLPQTEGVVRQRLYVPEPQRWSVDRPSLYTARTRWDGFADDSDIRHATFGIRTLQLDPSHGLRINGESVKLRGACIHHDNGILGAATFADAEERRVILLKAAGFNAIRSSHNPMSVAMLDACDRHGMLVMDETFDMWTESKLPFDYSLAFPEWWERDVEAMVDKDMNHPSVIIYSIGNEIPETGNAIASQWGRKLAEKIRGLDDTRFVTNGINGFVSALREASAMIAAATADATSPSAETAGEEATHADADGGVNAMMGSPDDFMDQVAASPLVTAATAESSALLDIVGLNYGDARYEMERREHPNRIVVGTETFPSRIDRNWQLVTEHPHVIGDFTWSGWDYLGEVGVGRVKYDGEPDAFDGEFPWLTSWSADLDITGQRRPISYYRETVFGLRAEPYIAVRRPSNHGRSFTLGQWSWTDAISSWSWNINEGSPMILEVYSAADEVELELNGRVVARSAIGIRRAFVADFEIPFEAGTLTAVAHEGGSEVGRTALRTASNEAVLDVQLDKTVTEPRDGALVFAEIELRDAESNLINDAERCITVTVTGAGSLAALGSGRPCTTQRFDHDTHNTYDGRVLAVVRPDCVGTIEITVAAPGLSEVAVHVDVRSPTSR